MKHSKKTPTKQLEKFSNIFTQLGLVLVLFVVYLTLEYKTEQKVVSVLNFDPPQRISIAQDQAILFSKEPKKEPKKANPKKSYLIPDEVLKGDNDIIETLVDLKPDEIIELHPDEIIEMKEPLIEEPETVPFINIEFAPIFKGCEGLSKEENKKCFDRSMKKFVQRNFDTGLANELGLSAGKHKIQTQFIIDNKGNVVDIQIRAPHVRLQKETQNLIQKLPKFIPGKQREISVKVKYTLPISFMVD